MARAIGVIIAAVALTAGCDDNLVGPSDVVGRLWQLVSIEREGAAPVSVTDPARYTLRLDEDGRVSVRSDCNSCGSSYSMSGLSVDIAPLTCTRVFCGETSLDSVYTQALEGTKTVSPGGPEMTISGNGSVLRFRR